MAIFFQRVEEASAFRSRVVARAHVLILDRELKEALPHGSAFCFAQLRQLFENLRRAHSKHYSRERIFASVN